jgi:hypothetical protein
MVKLMVATPCYMGKVDVRYMKCIMRLQKLCKELSIDFVFETLNSESLISRARNVLVSVFLKSECTHLLFIDADIQFSPSDVISMIVKNKKILCGAYPTKKLDVTKLRNTLLKNPDVSASELISLSSRLAINAYSKDKAPANNNIVEVHEAATGFMLLQREIVEKVVEHRKGFQFEVSYLDIGPSWDVFSTFVDNGRLLSEDYGFCKFVRDVGEKVYVDLEVNLNHIGEFIYSGNPLLYFSNIQSH